MPIEFNRTPAKGHVIVVDDDQDVLDALCSLVDLEGYGCTAFNSAQAYLDAIESRTIQAAQHEAGAICLLCDVKMPGIDGLQLQSSTRRHANIPVILMSGASGAREAASAFRAGAVDFLIKPIEPTQLFEALARAFALARERRIDEQRRSATLARLATLSEREMSVARLLASGLTQTAIGRELGITERTVKFHRRSIAEKLAIRSGADLVRLLDQYERENIAR